MKKNKKKTVLRKVIGKKNLLYTEKKVVISQKLKKWISHR